MQFDLFDQQEAKAQVGERQTDIEALIAAAKSNMAAYAKAGDAAAMRAGQVMIDQLEQY